MSKESYYFSHDSNARNDEKMIAVRMKLGMEGYGIYWAILEKMRDNSDYMCIKDYNSIAFDLRVSADKIKSLVEDFSLFQFTDDGKKFYSESFLNRMAAKDEKSLKAKKAAEKRWGKISDNEKVNANAMQTHNERNTDEMQTQCYKGKEKKVKENKIKEKIEIKANTKEDLPALIYMKKEFPSRYETDFLMKFGKQINSPQDFANAFNNKVDIEELKYDQRILFARLNQFANNWIKNQNKFNSQSSNKNSGNNSAYPIPVT